MFDLVTDALKRMFSGWWTFAPRLAARIMLALGIGITSYTLLLPELVSFVQSYLSGMSTETIALMSALKIDQALNMIFSALAARMGVRVSPVKLDPAP